MNNSADSAMPNEVRQDRVALFLVATLAFLIPVFVVPFSGISFQFSKVLVAAVGVIALIAIFAMLSFRRRSVSLSFSSFLGVLALLPLAYLPASIFSLNFQSSFFGYQFEPDTFGFALISFFLTAVVFWSLKTEKAVLTTLMAFLAGAWVVYLFQLVQLFMGAPFPIDALSSVTANLVGKWNDFGLFAGLVVALTLVALGSLVHSLRYAIPLYITIAVSLFFITVVDFGPIWYLVAGVAFMMFVFALTRKGITSENGTHSSGSLVSAVAPALVLVFVLFMLFVGSGDPNIPRSGISGALQESFQVESIEVRPSAESTLGILQSVYEKSPILGSGPNTFVNDWLLYRPADVLQTVFWNAEFNAGFGTFPTALITGGIVVGLAWLLIIGCFFYVAVRFFLGSARGYHAFFLASASGVGILYLFIAHILYVPSQSMTLLMFLMFGLFLASLHGTTLARSITIPFGQNPRVGFVATLALIVAVLLALISLLGFGRLYASHVQYSSAVASLAEGNFDEAREQAAAALLLSKDDRSYQLIALASLGKMNAIVASGDADAEAQNEFQLLLSNAIGAVNEAVARNPKNFQNLMLRASIYGAVVPLGIEGAYENAVANIEEAKKLNPGTPETDYALARLQSIQGDTADARASAERAVQKKPDYTPAILLVGQLALDGGDLNKAIGSVESALVFEPENAILHYQLGVLKIGAARYTEAAESLEKAISVSPDFANAKFFLGQAYVFLKKNDEALALFRGLEKENPGNETLTGIITELEAGHNPFAGGVEIPPEPEVVE